MKLKNTLMMTALVVGGLWAGSTALQAQDSTNSAPSATPSAKKPRSGFDGIAKVLNLTDDQKTKAKPIIEDMQQQIKDVRGDSTLSMTDKRAKMKGIREATTAKLKDILTPDQMAKWSTMG